MNEDKQTQLVKRLYRTAAGRLLLGVMTRPWVSKAAGAFMDSRLSVGLIEGFIRDNGIDMTLYEKKDYRSFNEFFTRRIKAEHRPVATRPEVLMAPCDGRLTVHPITADGIFNIKGWDYSMEELTRSRELAERYEGGTMLIFRLTVSDYHRFHYPDSGMKTESVRIPGVLHTVSPVAAEERKIYAENQREYFTLRTDNFGDMLIMPVGALLVGRICGDPHKAVVRRGEEAGYFEYGGSTVIVCMEKDVAAIEEDILLDAANDIEVRVRMGQQIGRAVY